MEYAYSIMVGLVVGVSFAGLVTAYMIDYTQNIDDKYDVITAVDVISDSSNLQIIKVTYTNTSNQTLELFEGIVSGCATCNHTEIVNTGAHTSNVVSWLVKNEIIRSNILDIRYTFDDKTVVIKTQRLQ